MTLLALFVVPVAYSLIDHFIELAEALESIAFGREY